MAREVIIRIRDDLEPEQIADKTLPFAFDGVAYEIDLTAAHVDAFAADMARWITAAREVVPEPKRRRRRRVATEPVAATGVDVEAAEYAPLTKPERDKIRAWARREGYEVSHKGKLSGALVDAYYLARHRRRPR